MARHPFGGGLSDWAIIPDTSGLAVLTGGAIVTLWSLPTGGTQYTDLTDAASVAITSVTSSDGTDGLTTGQVPQFYGPDGVWVMWAAINDPGDGSAPRQQMCSTDIGAQVDAQVTAAGVLQTSVNSFGALLGADSGIATLGDDGILSPDQRPPFTLADASDVDVSGASDGDGLVYDGDSSKWVPQSASALPGWTTITSLASGVAAYQVVPQYRFLTADTIQLVGRFTKVSGTFARGATVFTLPAEARPAQIKYVIGAANVIASHGAFARFAINPDGTAVISWDDTGYQPAWVGIDGILYDVGGTSA
jgi:hypothetical protein